MKFNRSKFIDETSGNIGAALDVIDDLVSVLNTYIKEDGTAEGYGGGCYGFRAEEFVRKMIKSKPSGEYFE